MTLPALIAAISVGGALLALWSYIRWPQAAPKTFRTALLHGIMAFGGLQLGATGLGVAVDTSAQAAALAVVAVVVPALTYAFLAALWMLRLFAGSLKGI